MKLRKLSRTSNQRKQLFRNLLVSLVNKGQITTTIAKAKSIARLAEKTITDGKGQSNGNLRQVLKNIGDLKTAKKVLELGLLMKNRPGGYTRVIKIGKRQGDDSEMVRLEWVEKLVVAEVVNTKKTEKKPVKPVEKIVKPKIEKPKNLASKK
jgi:large subunit ribosomal protein L17